MHALHPWVAFLILPVFAMGNTGLIFRGIVFSEIVSDPTVIGIVFGLVLGKPIGIVLFSYFSVKTGLASLPKEVRWSHILGGSMLGGIGFTMSLFISELSFSDPLILDYARIAILTGSVLSAVLGMSYLGLISGSASEKND
jgi:NhaA family Na+:H+ antiporter